MSAVSTTSALISKTHALHFSSGLSSDLTDQCVGATRLAFSFKNSKKSCTQKRALTVQASYSDGGRPSSASIFVGGFVLGGLIVGALGCVYAPQGVFPPLPQITKALEGADKKDLMKKLPKFIYDEEKVLEKQRKKLAEKIEQLNSAIDNVSSKLRSEEPSNEEAVNVEDIEALV